MLQGQLTALLKFRFLINHPSLIEAALYFHISESGLYNFYLPS